MFTQDYLLQCVHVQGEVSNCKYHSSGHIYFTLKDKKGTLSCVMFAGNRKGLDFAVDSQCTDCPGYHCVLVASKVEDDNHVLFHILIC